MPEKPSFTGFLPQMKDAPISIGPDPIPVKAWINGKHVRVGQGIINPETLIFTTTLDDYDENPNAEILMGLIKQRTDPSFLGSAFVSVSEMTILDEEAQERIKNIIDSKELHAQSGNDVDGQRAGDEQAVDTSADESEAREVDGHSPTPKFHNHD